MALSVDEARTKMQASVEHLQEELKKVRAGRANPAILDGVVIEAYGQSMPLKHAANVVATDAQLLTITPFDPNNLGSISTAISQSNLGLNPSDDGHVVRVPVPPLNEERRQEMVKSLSEKVEEARVSLRNIRHEVLNTAKQQKTSGELSEQDFSLIEKQVSEYMDEFSGKIEAAFTLKQAEIMTV